MSLTATCHCGATRITLPDHPTSAARCNCTFCARTGAVWAYYPHGALKIERADGQRDYSTDPSVGLHHFCGSCGMHTWGESIDWSTVYNTDGTLKGIDEMPEPKLTRCQVNLNLIDDLDWSRIEIEELDGRANW
ncbi:Uncharacterized conserved protein [Devosia crocina]|uniref:Uncharacterized conserved protein n=1 Tax=Devosia crocina TaxID=429728 RepID=A0A1I7N4Z8_9HYPH|nr:hypothetical protein [Devosia crocina]SFV29656.1 Uncharacterized conserved protein [Devosia crocina]